MKTLTQILQEQYAHGIKLNKIEFKDLIKQLEKAGGYKEVIPELDNISGFIRHIDKFKMAKDGKVTVGNDKMYNNIEDVVKTYRSTDDATYTLETWKGRTVLVGEGRPGTWYFIVMAEIAPVLKHVNPMDEILKNYKGNSYYKMNSLVNAKKTKTATDTETATSAKSKYENQLAWNKEIPQGDYKFEDEKVIPAAILNKIRQLVGLTLV